MILLNEQVSHHLLRVVGIQPDERVELFDGRGNVCISSLAFVKQERALMKWLADVDSAKEQIPVWVGLALTKRDAFSTSLRMLTEMGVSTLVPIQAERSIVKLQKSEKPKRWEKIVLSSLAQSKQATIPKLHASQRFADALDLMSHVPQKWVLHTTDLPDRRIVRIPLQKATEETAILIGPEGGFTDVEMLLAIEKGWTPASLSSNVLRADTAAIVAVARLYSDY